VNITKEEEHMKESTRIIQGTIQPTTVVEDVVAMHKLPEVVEDLSLVCRKTQMDDCCVWII
jgi:hypothetical protein